MSWVDGLNKAVSSANANARAEKADRQAVDDNPQNTLLNPNDLTGSYDASRLLMTTLGGEMRMVTASDLIAFAQNAQVVKSRFKKGITAKQVIDLSKSARLEYTGADWKGKSDIDKARAEIKHAIPHSIRKGLVRFITPSGSKEVARHYVSVRLLSWNAAVISPIVSKATGKPDWRKTALWVKNQPLKFDCDCGRHKFWFRYMATIGQYNEGRDERAFPKIRNPRLKGVACKHVLRVMSDIQTGHSVVISMIAKALENEHRQIINKGKVEATKISQKQAQKIASGKGRSAVGRAVRAVKEQAKKVVGKAKATTRQKITDTIKANSKAMDLTEQLAKELGISVEQLMSKMKG